MARSMAACVVAHRFSVLGCIRRRWSAPPISSILRSKSGGSAPSRTRLEFIKDPRKASASWRHLMPATRRSEVRRKAPAVNDPDNMPPPPLFRGRKSGCWRGGAIRTTPASQGRVGEVVASATRPQRASSIAARVLAVLADLGECVRRVVAARRTTPHCEPKPIKKMGTSRVSSVWEEDKHSNNNVNLELR